jgi:hypothetical protein
MAAPEAEALREADESEAGFCVRSRLDEDGFVAHHTLGDGLGAVFEYFVQLEATKTTSDAR